MRAPLSCALAVILLAVACGKSERATRNNGDEPRPSPKTTPPSDATLGNAPPNYAAGDTVLPHRELTLDSKALGEKRRINIYLPPGYEASPKVRYPILYMPDGGTKEDFPHLTYTADNAIRAGTIRPIVIVGIENTHRRRDLTGPTEVAEDKTIAPLVGGSARFRAFIRDELMPRVGKEVRGNGTIGIIGESLAGLFVVETFFLEPSLFDIYIAIDPSLGWNNQQLTRQAAERLQKGAFAGRILYLSSAGTGFDDGNSKFATPLAAVLAEHAPKQLRWSYQPHPGQKHATIYRATKLDILKRMFSATRE